jgi:HSP20 family protein
MAQFHLVPPLAGAGFGSLFDELRRDMDSLFNRYSANDPRSGAWRGVYPPVNLYETDEAFLLTAELPGVAPEEIEVTLEASTVTLQGERKIDYPGAEQTSLHRRERQAGSFRRAFELPAEIEADKVEAVHKNGVLMLRLPKSPAHQPRRISIRAH